MKKLTLVLLSLVLFGFAGSAMAEKPVDKPAKPEKSAILHCGCAWDGIAANMEYKEISISSKSRGHDAHVATTVDSCFNGEEEVEAGIFEDVYTDFVRSGDDCQLDGPPLGDPILDCPEVDPPLVGDTCGAELIIQ
jgi:hypothetical protein